MQRWAITLSAYTYELVYRPGSENNADALSRLPLEETVKNYVPTDIHALFDFIDKSPLNSEDIARETQNDSVLKLVYRFTLLGWPENKVNDNLRPYRARQSEISIENDCLLWGTRVIIPESLRGSVLGIFKLHAEVFNCVNGSKHTDSQ